MEPNPQRAEISNAAVECPQKVSQAPSLSPVDEVKREVPLIIISPPTDNNDLANIEDARNQRVEAEDKNLPMNTSNPVDGTTKNYNSMETVSGPRKCKGMRDETRHLTLVIPKLQWKSLSLTSIFEGRREVPESADNDGRGNIRRAINQRVEAEVKSLSMNALNLVDGTTKNCRKLMFLLN